MHRRSSSPWPSRPTGNRWSPTRCTTPGKRALPGILRLPMSTVKGDPDHRHHYQQEHTPFGTDGTSGDDPGAVQAGAQQVAGNQFSAVGDGIYVTFPPVPGRVKAHGKPQVPGAAQGEAEEESDDRHPQNAHPVLSLVGDVDAAEQQREQNRSGPEPDRATQGELRVATQQELFRQCDQQEERGPEQGKFREPVAVHRQAAEIVGVEGFEKQDQQGYGGDSPQQSQPEVAVQYSPGRQTISGKRPLLQARQEERR